MGGAREPPEEMQVLRVCRSVLRELKLAHPQVYSPSLPHKPPEVAIHFDPTQNEGGEQWRYLVSVVRQHKECKDSATLRQQERLLSSYYTYLHSSRRHRVSASRGAVGS